MKTKQLFILIWFIPQFLFYRIASSTGEFMPEELKECECDKRSFINRLFDIFQNVKCSCEEVNKKSKFIFCTHGNYNHLKEKCECEKCWTGEKCDKLIKRYIPYFTQSLVTLKASDFNDEFKTSNILSQHVRNACKRPQCPCGKTEYKLEKGSEDFQLNEMTGSLILNNEKEDLKEQILHLQVTNTMAESTENSLEIIVLKDEQGFVEKNDHESRSKRNAQDASGGSGGSVEEPSIVLTKETVEPVVAVDQVLPMKAKFVHGSSGPINLKFEITTNTKSFSYISMQNVKVDGNENYEGAVLQSSAGNLIMDRLFIDFGLSSTNHEITFDVKINDHNSVTNEMNHIIAAGGYIGEDTVVIESLPIVIKKDAPELQLDIVETTRETMFIYNGEQLNFNFNLKHNLRSSQDANAVYFGLLTENVESAQLTNMVPPKDFIIRKQNISLYQISRYESGKFQNTIEKEEAYTGNITLSINKQLAPLEECPITFYMQYENTYAGDSPPYMFTQTFYGAPPTIDFNLEIGENEEVAYGMRITFLMKINLIKTSTSLLIEVFSPEVDFRKTVSFIGWKIHNSSANIKGVENVTSQYGITRTSDTIQLDFKSLSNFDESTDVSAENEMIIAIDGIVNNLKKSEAPIIVYASVLAHPHMIWFGDATMQYKFDPNGEPNLNFSYTMDDSTEDLFQLNMFMDHSETSNRYAYNLSVEFFPTPYVELVSVHENSFNGDGFLFKYRHEEFLFSEHAFIKVDVKINRKKCPFIGEVQFGIPARVSYYKYSGQKYQYFRTLQRNVTCYRQIHSIPLNPNRVAHSYGRGMFIHEMNALTYLFVCMNQHAMSDQPACYCSTDYGFLWEALDSRLGSLGGVNSKGDLIWTSRNQMYYLHHDVDAKEYLAFLPKRELELEKTGLRILDSAEYVKPEKGGISRDHEIEAGGFKFVGGWEGVYRMDTTNEGDGYQVVAPWP